MDGSESILAKAPWLRYLLHGVGGGTALSLGLAAIDALRQRPEFLPQILSGNALWFALFVVGMVMFDRRMQSQSDLNARAVIAQEQLASAVRSIANKDDERAREQDVTLNYLARNTDKILQRLDAIEAGRGQIRSLGGPTNA